MHSEEELIAKFRDAISCIEDDINVGRVMLQLSVKQSKLRAQSENMSCTLYHRPGLCGYKPVVFSFRTDDGDIINIITENNNEYITIFKENTDKGIETYVDISIGNFKCSLRDALFCTDNIKYQRLATAKEKEKLFKAIKDNGYKWNPDTKTLDKLCPFNAGDVLVSDAGNIVLFSHIDDEQVIYYHCILAAQGSFCIVEGTSCGVGKVSNCKLATEEQRNKLFNRLQKNRYKYNPQTNKLEKLIVPKFKVGDIITNGKVSITIGHIDDNYYYEIGRNIANRLFIKNQDDWELVPNKFDITTLKPFDKVLVKCNSSEKWHIDFFEIYTGRDRYPFTCLHGNRYNQCIPYDGNEHLLDTTDECDDFYKTW